MVDKNDKNQKIVIKDYVLDKFLGEGSFGKVYKGINQTTKEEVAIKCMDMKLFKDPFLIDSLKNEIHVMKKLTSPNVVKMYDVIQQPKTTYIILEYCNEGDLSKFIRKNGGHLKESVAIDVLGQLMNGFKNLYELKYIHRDIKPPNALIKNGVHKVADFGFATKVDVTGRQLLKECVGTPLYMAPQLLENKSYGIKSDIWSIGMLFYEMIFGKTPWPCRDLNSFLRNIKTMPLRFSYDKPIAANTKEFIKKCLVIEEDKRMDWEEMFKHDIFKKNQTKEEQKIELPAIKLDDKSKEIFRKMQEIVQTHNLNIVQIFQNFDKDNGGDLSMKEFYKMLLVIDPRITYYEAEYIFKKVDVTQDGRVSLDEFKKVFVDYDFANIDDKSTQIITDIKEIVKANQIDLQKIFNDFDKDHGGELDMTEFTMMIRLIVPGMKDYEIKIIFEAFDQNKDGAVSYQEFRAVLAYGIKGQDKSYNPQLEKAKKLVEELKRIISKFNLDIKQIFKNFDKTGDGKLDLTEFNKLCKVIDKNLPMDDVKSIFRLFDEEGNGEITLNEFSSVINNKKFQK